MLDQTFYQDLDAFYRTGDAAGAEEYLKQQLACAWENEFNHGDRATILSELMGHYRTSGRFEECDEARKALLREIRALGLNDGPVYATFMLNIANACRAMGMLEEAEKSFIHVRDIYERTLEPDDFRMASLCNNLGLTYRAMDRLDDAEANLKQALGIVEQLPDAWGALAATCSNLADLCCDRGDMDEAATYARRAVETYEANGAASGVDWSAALAAEARIEFRAGRFAHAAELYGRAAEAVRAAFGDTPTVVTLLANRDEALRHEQADGAEA